MTIFSYRVFHEQTDPRQDSRVPPSFFSLFDFPQCRRIRPAKLGQTKSCNVRYTATCLRSILATRTADRKSTLPTIPSQAISHAGEHAVDRHWLR